MDLCLRNSLHRQLEPFRSLAPGHVGMYSCGPTVYSYQHIGNMRAYVFADTLKRALRWRGYDVRHVINITDVGHLLADADQGEDKVEEASRREGRTVDEITGHYTEVFRRDLEWLNVLPADEWPKASSYIAHMIEFAAVLEARGFAYVLPEGLYFDTSTQAGYGALAGIDTTAQRATGRVDTVAGKRAPSDFALWRTFTDGRLRLMQWESPWGVGAPGWHLECSVMSIALLGSHFDIHTGGVDHRELHHVNEIAQSEAYLSAVLGDGEPWVPYWLHGEFLNLKDRKMAKSEGGTLLLSDLVDHGIHPLAFRYLLLQSHYASQIEFSETAASAAHVSLKRLMRRLGVIDDAEEPVTLEAASQGAGPVLLERLNALDAAVADDLMTPTVVALVQTWARSQPDMDPEEWAVLIRAVNSLTGLSLGTEFAPVVSASVDVAWVEEHVAARDAARAARDWDAADKVRDALGARGIRVEDTPEGTHWFSATGPH